MPSYQYEAVNTKGKKVTGQITADNIARARGAVQALGYSQIEMKKREPSAFTRLLLRSKAPTLVELSVSTRLISVMLDAGLTLPVALEVLTAEPGTSRLHLAWQQVLGDIEKGNEFSRALMKHPEIFSLLYIGMVRTGEASGGLVHNLRYLADYLEGAAKLRAKIIATLTYPAIVFVIVVCLTLMLTQYVFPQFFNGMFRSSGLPLPAPTQLLVNITDFMADPKRLLGLFGGILFLVVALVRYVRTPFGRHRFELILLRTPHISSVISKILALRFCQTLGTLINSGISLLTALEMTDIILDNYVMSDYLQNARRALQDGETLHQSIAEIPYFPVLVSSFVEVGEQSGKLGDLLLRLARSLEDDLDMVLTEAVALLEPLLIGGLGLVVGFVVIAIFLPLYQIIGQF